VLSAAPVRPGQPAADTQGTSQKVPCLCYILTAAEHRAGCMTSTAGKKSRLETSMICKQGNPANKCNDGLL
jgi:hypothetical protein